MQMENNRKARIQFGTDSVFNREKWGSRPKITVEEQPDSLTIRYIFPHAYILKDEWGKFPFKKVLIDGAGYFPIRCEGYFSEKDTCPELPSIGRFIQVPLGCDAHIVYHLEKMEEFILSSSGVELKGNAQEVEQYSHKTKENEESFFPLQIVTPVPKQNVPVKSHMMQTIDEYNLFALHVNPLQYNPHSRILRFHHNITVTVTFTPEENITDVHQVRAKTNHEAFGNLFLNPRRLFSVIKESEKKEYTVEHLHPDSTEFLIIYDSELKEAAEKLKVWKDTCGLKTDIVDISADVIDPGDAVAIRKYIFDRRNTPLSSLRYVLLLGDVNREKTVGKEKVETETEMPIVAIENNGNTTDHYYFTQFDRGKSDVPQLPWVAGGRIPVTDRDEAMSVVKQIIDYEKNPPRKASGNICFCWALMSTGFMLRKIQMNYPPMLMEVLCRRK